MGSMRVLESEFVIALGFKDQDSEEIKTCTSESVEIRV